MFNFMFKNLNISCDLLLSSAGTELILESLLQ